METLSNLNHVKHHVMLATHLFLFFFLFYSWCRGALYPLPHIFFFFFLFFVDVMELYTHWSYTCSAKISFNLGLTFSINDFILCSCSSHLILFMIMLSYIYASYNFICFSIPFQIHHENIILNSFKII